MVTGMVAVTAAITLLYLWSNATRINTLIETPTGRISLNFILDRLSTLNNIPEL
jgi:hypothetical protein